MFTIVNPLDCVYYYQIVNINQPEAVQSPGEIRGNDNEISPSQPPRKRRRQSRQPDVIIDSSVISQWCQQVIEQFENISEKEMEDRRQEMNHSWHSLTPLNVLDYNDPMTQCAYIRWDVPLRASFVSELMKTHDAFSFFFNGQNPVINIVSIGCGPSTEMIAILQFLIHSSMSMSQPENLMIRFLLVDRATCWTRVIDKFETVIRDHITRNFRRRNPPIYFEKVFYEFDLTRDNDLNSSVSTSGENLNSSSRNLNIPNNLLTLLPSCRMSDLFTFSLIFSEILKEGSAATLQAVKNIQQLFHHAKNGAVFLFIEIEQWIVKKNMIKSLEDNVFNPGNSHKDSKTVHFTLPENQTNSLNGGKLFCLLYTKL